MNKSKFKNKAQILTEWPDEGLKKININDKTFIVTLTHDPKLDDPAIIYSLNTKSSLYRLFRVSQNP